MSAKQAGKEGWGRGNKVGHKPGIVLIVILCLHLMLQLLLDHVQIIIQRSQGTSDSRKLSLLQQRLAMSGSNAPRLPLLGMVRFPVQRVTHD